MAVCTIFFISLVCILPLLYVFNRTVRFYTKVTAVYIIVALASLLPIPLAIFRPRDPRNTNYSAFLTQKLSKMFNIQWEFRNWEHLDIDEPVVIVCNHQSVIDVIGMMLMWPKLKRCVPVIKRELLFAGPFGFMAWLSGSVFVDRQNSAQAREMANKAVLNLTEKKTKLWVFPEGTRNNSGTMLSFKKGAFHMAVQAQVPIAPLVISSYLPFYDMKKKKFDNGGKVIVTALPVVSVKGKTSEDVNELIDNIRKDMMETFCSVSNLPNATVTNGVGK